MVMHKNKTEPAMFALFSSQAGEKIDAGKSSSSHP
jgi:hypothetical protein